MKRRLDSTDDSTLPRQVNGGPDDQITVSKTSVHIQPTRAEELNTLLKEARASSRVDPLIIDDQDDPVSEDETPIIEEDTSEIKTTVERRKTFLTDLKDGNPPSEYRSIEPYEYDMDNFAHYFDRELLFRPDPNYPAMIQPNLSNMDINSAFDTVIYVTTRLHIRETTTFLALDILHRFMAKHALSHRKLLLIVCTCIYSANKLVSPVAPRITARRMSQLFSHRSDGFSPSSLVSAERLLLSTLDFRLVCINPYHYIRRLARYSGLSSLSYFLAFFLCQLSSRECGMLGYKPSEIAAAAVLIGHQYVSRPQSEWRSGLEYWSSYSIEELQEVRQGLLSLWKTSQQEKSFIFRKFRLPNYRCVSELPIPAYFWVSQ
eukprot:gnl/Dysnectes_brevis/1600_a1811_1780.p1 GENE.gnl/Dysnectes_brevis/1600_a1811_1780~~gnl/Dysnectes_brevis/1600_a1811_1780.p1  ORF type:complete len:375 (+),score=73.91 gnl/Dysnectes_brevis/1600_a1811_1780:46-1170(+)